MNAIFDAVYTFLKWISACTGLSYREVNIIVYFIAIPGLFVFLLSRLFQKKSFLIAFVVIVGLSLLIIPDFTLFSEQLFENSVAFLNWFEVIGLNYIQASVIVCVVLPLLLIVLLWHLNKRAS